jgi:hypothetical protein
MGHLRNMGTWVCGRYLSKDKGHKFKASGVRRQASGHGFQSNKKGRRAHGARFPAADFNLIFL